MLCVQSAISGVACASYLELDETVLVLVLTQSSTSLQAEALRIYVR